MSRAVIAPEVFGREVLGPVVGEFCLRLWSLAALMDRPDDVVMLFCARGGLRMKLAYERFLAAAGLPCPVRIEPLMVSRVAAIRPGLLRTIEEKLDHLLPVTSSTLAYEFRNASLAQVSLAMSGVLPSTDEGASTTPFTPQDFVALLRHPGGAPVVEAISGQASLFVRHLRDAMGDSRHVMLVDTGLYGTTRQLLAEGLPDVDISSAMIARSYRPGLPTRNARTFGLSVEADGYSPLRRRTALLRYWHFVEWLFEPELPSVRTFTETRGIPRSNLEVEGWQERIPPAAGTAFAGVLDYLDSLPHGPAPRIVRDADRAWDEFRQAVVWPGPGHVNALSVGSRSHDFGLEATWSARPWRGAISALRGASMWREGEIAGSGSPIRRPLLAAVETAYAIRRIKRVIKGRRSGV